MQYIGKYYTYARELSDSSSIWEMVSSIYMAFVVENNVTGRTQNHGPFHNTALHFKGLWDSVWHSVRINALNADGQSFRIPGGEMILLTILSSFLWRCNSLRFREEQGWEEDAVGAIEAALRCFLSGFAFATPLQMLVALEYCFNIYWSCYRPASTESSINSTKDANNFISKRLKFILQQMRNLLSQIASGHDDTTTRLLMMIGWKRIEWAKQNLNLLSILSELTQGGGMEIYNLRVALVPRARDIFRAYCKSKSQYFNQSGFLCQAARALYWAWLVLVPDLTNEGILPLSSAHFRAFRSPYAARVRPHCPEVWRNCQLHCCEKEIWTNLRLPPVKHSSYKPSTSIPCKSSSAGCYVVKATIYSLGSQMV